MILSWSQFWVACPLTKAKVKKFLEGRTYIFTLFSLSPREQTCRRKRVKNMLKSLACLVIGKCTMRGHDTPTRSPKFPDTVLANRHRSRKCLYSTVYNVSWNKRFPYLSLEQTPLRGRALSLMHRRRGFLVVLFLTVGARIRWNIYYQENAPSLACKYTYMENITVWGTTCQHRWVHWESEMTHNDV